MEMTGEKEHAYRVALVAFPGIRAFDVSVITEVWGTDRTDRGAPSFDLRRAAPDTTPVPMRGGLTLLPDRTLDWLPRADLIVIPGLDDHLTSAPTPSSTPFAARTPAAPPSRPCAAVPSPSPRPASSTAAAPSPTGT